MPQLELALWSGFAIGIIFGATGQISGFCLHRGLQQFWSGRDGYQLHAFALALAIALSGTHVITSLGLVNTNQSLYMTPNYSWALMASGGLLFGYGMALSNGCGARALVLLGQGNLRSLVVLLCLGISAYVTISGLIAPMRLRALAMTTISPQNLTLAPGVLRSLVIWAVVAALVVFALRKRESGERGRTLFGGIVIGLLIVAGWLTTGWLGADDFDPMPVTSLTFVAPVGDTIQYVMIATGMNLRFGIAVVLGVLMGSLLTALLRRQYRLQSFEAPRQMGRYIIGGILMGVGGTLALGCTIGQGLTGLSTLAFSSVISSLAIVAGARLAWMRQQALPSS